MRPTYHVVISASLGTMLFVWLNSVAVGVSFFLTGVLIDLDHILDYFIAKKKICTRYDDLVNFCGLDKVAKLYLILHSYELMIVLWLVIFYLRFDAVLLGVTLGAIVHIFCDQISNPFRPLGYFITYRLFNEFRREKLFRKEYVQKYLTLSVILFLCCFSSVDAAIKPGETLVYKIKKMGVNAGKATIEYKGETTLNGKDALLMIVTVDGFNFYDEEKLFLDKSTFLPMVVERDINIFGSKEKIREEYDQQKGVIKIIKNVKGRLEEITIDKKKAVENIYGFIYRYRQNGSFVAGETIGINLPTKEVIMEMKDKCEFSVAKKLYDAYYMEGKPNGIKVWFGADDKHIPLRIDGSTGFGKTSMIFLEYK